MAEKFLDKTYGLTADRSLRNHYDDWSASYDAEISDNGYQTPARLARLLAGLVADKGEPLLDFGCGTGMSGVALKNAGFSTLDGFDISAGMLEVARGKGIYRSLSQLDPEAELPFTPGEYRTIAAIGVVSVGAAPPEVLDTLMQALAPGGLLALSYNDHTLADPGYMDRLSRWSSGEAGSGRELAREYGAHLPGIDLNSMIYVLEKA